MSTPTDRYPRRHKFLLLFGFIVLLCGTSCQKGANPTSIPPVPDSVENADRVELADGREQLSFVAQEAYPSTRISDFYLSWATDNGWTQVPQEIETWSTSNWTSFEDENGTKMDVFASHWRSPDGVRSLRLALVHRGDRSRQEVFVTLSPFYLLDSETKTLGEYVEDWGEQ